MIHADGWCPLVCRKQKLEEAEQRRIAAEEEMEARRLELIKEGGYWKNRMAQDEKTHALQEESIIKADTQVTATLINKAGEKSIENPSDDQPLSYCLYTFHNLLRGLSK